jgi:hypothetical protein
VQHVPDLTEQTKPRGRLWARPGDRLLIHGHRLGEPERDAEILETRGEQGGPPFLVRWQDDGHESLFFPSSDASVEHFGHRRARGRKTRAKASRA